MIATPEPAPTASSPPLDGVRVLELGSGTAVASRGKLLAQSGVELIRVEPPGGDPIRVAGSFRGDEPDIDAGGLHRLLNPGKRSLALDITSEQGARQHGPLLAPCDLLLGSWRTPSALPLGDPERLLADAPATTFVSISEFGCDGPYAEHEADSHLIPARRAPAARPASWTSRSTRRWR